MAEHVEASERPARKKNKGVAASLAHWFAENARELPWRRNRTPYKVWISEIMLQQTQVKTVIPYFNRWLKTFPSIEKLAASPIDKVLKAWEGLGYYRRARHLHEAAKIILQKHAGIFPKNFEAILALPGIGPYTAGAIASLAFGQAKPLVDGNVERVLARVFAFEREIDSGESKKWFWEKAARLVEEGVLDKIDPGVLNESLMELGATVCTPALPNCPACPLKKNCVAQRRGLTQKLPLSGKKNRVQKIFMAAGVLRKSQGANKPLFFIRRKEAGEWSGGLWEFPTIRVAPEDRPEKILENYFLSEWNMKVRVNARIAALTHTVTHHRIWLQVFSLTLDEAKSHSPKSTAARWLDRNGLEKMAFPASQKKILQEHLSA